MSSSGKGFWNNRDAILDSSNKMTSLNPNAAEFVPSARRYLPGNHKNMDMTKLEDPGTSGKAILDQSMPNISSISDDEAHRYWRHQLPDDITPDFKGMEDGLLAPAGLTLAGLSMDDRIAASKFPTGINSHLLGISRDISPQGAEYKRLSKRMGDSVLLYTDDLSSAAFVDLSTNPLDKQFMNGDQHLINDRARHYGGNSSAGFPSGLSSEPALLDGATIYAVEFLASKFTDYTAESLAKLYHENGCNINLTIEALTGSQLTVDNNFTQKNSKALPAPSPGLEFPALPVPDIQNKLSTYSGQDLRQVTSAFQFVGAEGFSLFKSIPSTEPMGTQDLASAVHRLASRESEHCKYERNGTAVASTGPSTDSQLLASSYNAYGKTAFADKLQGLIASSWLRTGDMAQLYPEEGHDFACLQDACFDQAKRANLSGNRTFAKEIGAKGHLYDIPMREAREKARESIYRQRNPVTQAQSHHEAHNHLIDLHGLHVNEAIHVLKHELGILRRTARSVGQPLQVMVRVSIGPHVRGSRNLVRLSIAVQQYLLDENLQFSENQPGLLRVVIC